MHSNGWCIWPMRVQEMWLGADPNHTPQFASQPTIGTIISVLNAIEITLPI